MEKKKTKPMYKPKKQLSLLQTRLMKTHKKFHTEKHIKKMKQLMLQGHCLQSAHDIAIKQVGK